MKGRLAPVVVLLSGVLLVGCFGDELADVESPPKSVETTEPVAPVTTVGSTGPPPTTSSGETEVTAVTMPVPPPPDYGIYEDAILAGAQTHARTIEYANFKAECYAEFGIAARVLGPGHLELPYAPEQESLANEAHVECEQRAIDQGLIPDPMQFPPERLRLWYRAYVEVAYECLVANGYPTSPPPSMDVWVEEYPDTWLPHGSRLPDEAFEVCPQELDLLLIELGKRDEAKSGS
jgi:hypothetical protein